PLEEHAFGLGEREDGIERVLHRIDKAGGALRIAIAGDGKLHASRFGIPVPVLRVGVGLEAVARSEEHTSELSHRTISYAVFCLKLHPPRPTLFPYTTLFRSPLEEHAFGLGEREDGIERVLHRIDKAGGALRIAIAGDGKLHASRFGIPVPVLRVGVGLEAVARSEERRVGKECRCRWAWDR